MLLKPLCHRLWQSTEDLQPNHRHVLILIFLFVFIKTFLQRHWVRLKFQESGIGKLQSMGSLGVRQDWATSLSLFTFTHWRRKWQATPVFLLENPRDRGAWCAAVYGVTQSRTRLKRLSSSSSMNSFRFYDLLCKIFMLKNNASSTSASVTTTYTEAER